MKRPNMRSFGRALAHFRINCFSVKLVYTFFILFVFYWFCVPPFKSMLNQRKTMVMLATGGKDQNNMVSKNFDDMSIRTPNGKVLDSNRKRKDEPDESPSKSNRSKTEAYNPTQPKTMSDRKHVTESNPSSISDEQKYSQFDLLRMKAPNDPMATENWSRNKFGYVLKIDQTEIEERKRDKEVKEMRRRLPQVLTIGVAKCGTTALNFFLQMNPFLCPSRSESNFFVFWDRYSQGYSWYRLRMHQSYLNQITMDQGTHYAQNPGILPRVAAVNKNMKFILVMCDPVSRDVSHFVHGQSSNGRNVNGTFEN